MRVLAIAGLLLMTACDVRITVPIAVIGDRGEILTGTAVSTLSTGTFEVGNGVLTCAGSYDPGPGLAVSFTTLCSDGRRGFGQAIRDRGGLSGQGTMRMDDGEGANFLFGPAAANFQPRIAAQPTPPPPPTAPRSPRT